jgi:CheY-like chemotaxis protein
LCFYFINIRIFSKTGKGVKGSIQLVKTNEPFIILMVDDDPDDYYLMNKALSEKGIKDQLLQLSDGIELMDYLSYRGKYADAKSAPRPKLILLDLNMPRMDGREALKKIRAMDQMKEIPVIIFTTSREKRNIQQCYLDGADEYIVKPTDFEGLLHVADNIKRYWI